MEQPIETAPTDGTVVDVRNWLMLRQSGEAHWVQARYGKYTCRHSGATSMQWTIVRDPHPIMGLPPGTMVCPTVWRPLQEQR